MNAEMATFIDSTFASYEEFEEKFNLFKAENSVTFRKKTSETVAKANAKSVAKIPPHFVYSRVEFTCTHFGQPKYRGNGVKSKTNHTATGCEAKYVLKYDYYEKVLRISKAHLEHNHPTTPETYSQEYQVKRLTQTQRKTLKEIVDLNPQNEKLMRLVNTKFNKAFTLSEIRRLKHQLLSGRIVDDMQELLDNLEGLQEQAQMRVSLSDNGAERLLDMVAFSTTSMVAIFKKYLEVIYMDGTYKNNKTGFPLYQIMVEDNLGRGRTVFYAFVRQENAELLTGMVRTFVEFMGEAVGKTTHAMTDKDPNEVNAIKTNLPQASTMLCAFHVHKAMKAKVHKMQCPKEVKDRLQHLAYVLVTTNDIATCNKKLQVVQTVSSDFFEYLNMNWLGTVDSWAYHARLHSRLFLNDTNNKCEGENRRLKEILNTNTSIAVAVRKLFEHSLTQQFEVSTASVVQTTSTTVYRDANPHLQDIYANFTPYAVQLMIQEHNLLPQEPVTIHHDGYDCHDTSGIVYRVSGCPLSCHCPFFCQTSLPCCHIVSIFLQCTAVTQEDLFNQSNRWLKCNIVEGIDAPQVTPAQLRNIVGPEARHHRTEAALSRLSGLLKLCGTCQFEERLSKVETLMNAWEGNKDCVVVVAEVVGDRGVDGEEVLGDRGVDGDEVLGDRGVDGEEVVGDRGVDGDEVLGDRGVDGDEVLGDRGVDGEEVVGDRGVDGEEFVGDRGVDGKEVVGDRGVGGDEVVVVGDRGVGGDEVVGDRGIGGEEVVGDRGVDGDEVVGDRGVDGDEVVGDRGAGGEETEV